MSGALYVGTSGLAAAQKQLDIIGNNLANSSTVGFKSSDVSFASVLSQSLSTGAQAVGEGVMVNSMPTSFSQGTFESTGNNTDLAIDGNGFFVVRDGTNQLYTRAGGFRLTSDGSLRDLSGFVVQGHMYDQISGKENTAALEDLTLGTAQSQPQVTTNFTIGATLNSKALSGDTFTASHVVYDNSGADHTMITTFTNMDGSSYWGVQTTLDGKAAINPPYAGVHFSADGAIDTVYAARVGTPAKTGTVVLGTTTPNTQNLYKATTGTPITLEYTAATTSWGLKTTAGVRSDGGYTHAAVLTGSTATSASLDLNGDGTADVTFTGLTLAADKDEITYAISETGVTTANNELRFYAAGGALENGKSIGTDGVITWNLTTFNKVDAPTLQSFAATSRITALGNDGYAMGFLSSLKVGKDGIVEGAFDNGQQQKLARILLHDFDNLQALGKQGSYFIYNDLAGTIREGAPGTGVGSIRSAALEMSNTDTAKEFIKMITAQRAYQSNAKTISTADQMLQTLMNIKQ